MRTEGDDHQHLNTRLTPEDASALDELVDGGFSSQGASARHERIVKLLRTLEHESKSETAARERQREVRVGVTMARVGRIARQAPGTAHESHEDELSPLDQDALDAFVQAGYRATKVPGSLADRARVAEQVGMLLDAGLTVDSAGRAERVDNVLAAVQQARMRLRPVEVQRASRGFRWSDLISIAAVLLIGASIVWPLGASMRAQSQQAACAGNLASIAEALGLYAGNNRDSMPVAPNGWGGWDTPSNARWWSVGHSGSNSANLFRLASLGYTKLGAMACDGNPDAVRDLPGSDPSHQFGDWTNLHQVSYSFQIRVPDQGLAWRGERGPAILLADRSPVVLRAVQNQVIFPMQNSPNHDGRGQNVLKSDGSVAWLATPIDESDDPKGNNIWLPSQIEDLIREVEGRIQGNTGQRMEPIKGQEVPGSPRDTFLGP